MRPRAVCVVAVGIVVSGLTPYPVRNLLRVKTVSGLPWRKESS
jgi:hypothetical protein